MIPLLVATLQQPALPAPPPKAVAAQGLRAQYAWGYADAHGEGRGTLSVLIELATGRVVLELHGLGERLMLLQGDRTSGYRVQIPKRELDRSAATLAELPLPFLPDMKDAEGLHRLLATGQGPGVEVTRKDRLGPVKLHYLGKDEKGDEVQVWMERTRWEPAG